MTTAVLVEAACEADAMRNEIVKRHAALARQGHAEVLGLEPHARGPEVKAAYLALARRFHPDRGASLERDLKDKLQAIFIRLNEAYRSLQSAPPTPPRSRLSVGASDRPASAATASHAPARAARDEKAVARESVERAIALACDQLASGDPEAAITALHDVFLRADGRLRQRVRLLLARAYSSDPRWKTYAVRLLRELLHETPADAEALVLQAELYRREGLLARAEATLRRALSSDPESVEARALLSVVSRARQGGSGPPAEKPRAGGGFLARMLARRTGGMRGMQC
jgi:tetratricopeptide (TPR) repeat protein